MPQRNVIYTIVLWMPQGNAKYTIGPLNESFAHIPYGVLIGDIYEKVIKTLEKCYSNHHLEALYHSQLERAQLIWESQQEFAAIIHHCTHSVHTELSSI
jgi:hypothetical protein